MFLMIDNYDSFVYNLKAYFEELGREIMVRRSDQINIEEIEKMQPEGIILSPGPKRPWDAVRCVETVKWFQGKIPILGVCLGHQSICEAFGGTVSYAKELMHGKQSLITQDGRGIFEGIPSPVHVARYHSLAVDEKTLPDVFDIFARTEDGEIMAMQHKEYPLIGIQFHPESIYTDHGKKMIENFLKL